MINQTLQTTVVNLLMLKLENTSGPDLLKKKFLFKKKDLGVLDSMCLKTEQMLKLKLGQIFPVLLIRQWTWDGRNMSLLH